MSKLTKYLEGQSKKIYSSVETNTIYYYINNIKIRLSDHLPGKDSLDNLNIILPQKSSHDYIVILNTKFFIYKSFTELRVFLDHYLFIVNFSLDQEFEKVRISNIRKDRAINDLVRENKDLKKQLKICSLSKDNIIASQLTKKQLSNVYKWIAENSSK